MRPIRALGAALLAALLLAPGATPAQRPPPLPPGSWNVNWGERRCSLIRQSESSPPSYFALQVVPGSYRSDLRVVSRDWPRGALAEPDRLTITFHPQGWAVPGRIRVEWTDAGQALVIYDASEDAREAFAAAQSVRVAKGGVALIDIPLPASARALSAFRECEATVMREWGIDPIARAAVRIPPRGNLASFVTDNDYPPSALRRSAQGSVIFRLDLDPTGRAVDCTILASSGDESLDASTCRIMRQRARLEPAIGLDGMPVASTLVASLHWRIAEP